LEDLGCSIDVKNE